MLVRVEMLDGRTWTTIARGSQPWVEIAAAQSWWEVAETYVVQGIRHILFGADHLLFVLGLLLIVADRWMLVKTVTAFTRRAQHHARASRRSATRACRCCR